MLNLGGYKIAKTQDEFISSLFIGGGTLDGVINKINKRSVKFNLFDQNYYYADGSKLNSYGGSIKII